ncbi:MAG: FtsX-like permease family protein [Candidatus Aenigmarchaeota archaeon]|nr:FtsX-like permease family protein [Candidatus Aenigmarchaeota archaeon]NIP40324.1 FtsX-like permease family protein [Candidatus Aenigmarchaeota archaeon]NIQ17818.1 FtsX-like permease family protein [Candidatus Aenigmarchaeota archaeon]NIS73199.1 FtsX-like permease family protein [Candidatus Aenigmarchaeota archaeon]
MLDLALKDLKEHKVRTILTALGIFIAITAIVSLGSISAGVNELIASSGILGSDYVFVMKSFEISEMIGPGGAYQIEDIEADTLEELKSLSGVDRVVPIIARQFGGFFEVDGLDMDNVDMFGAENLEFKEGGWPENEDRGAALGFLPASMLDVVVGDYITLNKKEVEVMGIFEEGSGAYDLVILMPYDYADEIYETEGGATQIIIEPEDVTLVEEIKQTIEDEHDDLDAMTMEDALSMMEEVTGTLNIMTFGIGFIASIVAAIGIIITMYTSVLERRRQLGIMKAVGALRRTILIQILQEGLLLSVASSVLAVGISFFFVDLLNNVLLGGINLAVITPVLAIGAVAYGVLLTVISSLYPAWIAVKTDPIKAIREG